MCIRRTTMALSAGAGVYPGRPSQSPRGGATTFDKIAIMAVPVLDSRGVAAVATAVGSWGVLIIVSRVLVAGHGYNPWVLAFVQMAVGGVAMIVVAGRGPLPLRPLLRLQTWVYGILRVVTAAAFTVALGHATSAEVSVLSSMFIPIGLGLAWLMFARRPSPADGIGSMVVLAGVVGVAVGLPGGMLGPASVLMAISAGCTAIAERHPDNQGDDRRERLRLTGAVMLATAILMLLVALAVSHVDPDGPVAAAVPIEAATDPALWIAGLLIGALLRGPSTYATFRAIRMVGSENYLMGTALLPAFNLAAESLAASAGLIAMPSLASGTVVAGAVGMLGAVMIATLRWRARVVA